MSTNISFMSTNTIAGKHNLMHMKTQLKIMLHKQHKRVFCRHCLVDSQKILLKLHLLVTDIENDSFCTE